MWTINSASKTRSTNGTQVNGERVERSTLQTGDVLTVGRRVYGVAGVASRPCRTSRICSTSVNSEVRLFPPDGRLRPWPE